MFSSLATGVRHFHKGEIILAQGVEVEYLYWLQSGSCYRNLITAKGDSVIYEIKEADCTLHSMIGALAVYNKTPGSQFTYVARTDCVCHCIPSKDFLAWAAEKPDIQNQLLRLTLHYYEQLRLTYQAHQEGCIANRMCQILLECIEYRSEQKVISKRYHYSEIAGMLGVHTVTFSRIIRALCEKGILQKSGSHTIVKDHDTLIRLANHELLLDYK